MPKSRRVCEGIHQDLGLSVVISGGLCRDRAPGQQQRRREGSNPAPGGPGGATTGAFCFFFGLFGSRGEKAKPEKTRKSFLRKRKNLPKREKQKTKKTSPNHLWPRPMRYGAKCGEFGARAHPKMGGLGGLGPSMCPQRNLGRETGILGQSHGPDAKQTQKRGFGVTGASRSQNWAGKGNLERKMSSARGIWG